MRSIPPTFACWIIALLLISKRKLSSVANHQVFDVLKFESRVKVRSHKHFYLDCGYLFT